MRDLLTKGTQEMIIILGNDKTIENLQNQINILHQTVGRLEHGHEILMNDHDAFEVSDDPWKNINPKRVTIPALYKQVNLIMNKLGWSFNYVKENTHFEISERKKTK